MRSEDVKNDARSVVVTVDAQAKALKKLSEIKDFQVATPEWDWKTVFGFYKPQKINWKLYRVEGPGGVELNPNEKIFESVDKIDPNSKDLKVVLMNKKDSTPKENGEVAGKKGAAKPKGAALKLPRTKQQARRSVPVPKTPKPKTSVKQNGKPGDKDAAGSKTPDTKKMTSDAGVQSPRPNGSVGVGSGPSSAKKSKTPKKDSKPDVKPGTPKIEGTSEKGTTVAGLPKKTEEKVPIVGLVLGQGTSAPVAGTAGTSGPASPKAKKRKNAKDAADLGPGGPPAKKAAPPKPKPTKPGDGPGGDRVSPPKNAPEGGPKKAGKKKPKNEPGVFGAGPSNVNSITGPFIPSSTSSIAERFALISKDTSLPINRPNTGKSPGNKKPVGVAGVQGINSRFNGYVDPSVAAEIVAECKKIKENPETRNFMRQRAAYIYNMIMHVFLNE